MPDWDRDPEQGFHISECFVRIQVPQAIETGCIFPTDPAAEAARIGSFCAPAAPEKLLAWHRQMADCVGVCAERSNLARSICRKMLTA
jgi:hypothetical protein